MLLEPIMAVGVVTAEDCAGPINGNLDTRRGQVLGQDLRGNASVIRAMVPLTNMFGYADTLWGVSRGRATFTMQFDRYALVPPSDDDPPFRPAIGMRA